MSLSSADERRRRLARRVRALSVEGFHDRLAEAGVERAFVVFENGRFTLSHPGLLADVRAFFESSRDFAGHEGVFVGRDPEIPTLFFAFVHDTRRGLGQGGLRYMPYDGLAPLLLDGLRLARGMTRKNALAGLHWGGGKGILARTGGLAEEAWGTPGSPERERLFRAYGRFIASLGGIYVTAEDVGTKTSDMNAILGTNRFVTCIGSELGGSGNPSPYTARGVFRAMQAGWRFLSGTDDLRSVRVAIQGVGNVGEPLVELLHDAGAELWATDLDRDALERVARDYGVRIVEGDEIYDLDVDVFAPCAIGAVVNAATIPRLRVRLICGAANNILGHAEDAERLRRRGIVYVPDYLCNRMGITNCCDEWAGNLPEEIRLAAERVYPDTLRVLKHARTQRITSAAAADQLADIAACELHPWMGHRGRLLSDRLIASGWHLPDDQRPLVAERTVAAAFDPGLDEPPIRVREDREGVFRGTGRLLASSPISTAGRPDLAAVFSAVLVDVRARALEALGEERPRRAIGSDPGGLALQMAVERTLPWEREEIGRAQFVERCEDLHRTHDAAIREQLDLLGVGFAPEAWLDPMSAAGRAAVDRLFAALTDTGLSRRERRLTWFDPSTRSALISPDVVRDRVETNESFTVRFRTTRGEEIVTQTFAPELLPGAVALVVRRDGPFGDLAGREVPHPLHGEPLPVVAIEGAGTDAKFLVPAHDRSDHQLAERLGLPGRPAVIDEQGRFLLLGEAPMQREQARQRIVESLGDRIERHERRFVVDAWRSRGSESLVYLGESEQLFVDLARGARHFERAVESGAVTFSGPRWRQRALDAAASIEPWCVSRQYWWGHEVPGSPRQEVASVWCSLVAWMLQARGWPTDPAPPPIAELVVDSDLFHRWVLPAQMISLVLTGRPAASHVHVHGVLHVAERALRRRDDAPAEGPDEELFVHRTVRRPMRRRLGNAVEPGTLVRRFGADAVRLGLLLSLNPSSIEVATAEESHFRRAVRTVRRLSAKVGGIAARAAEVGDAEPAFADRWITVCVRDAADRARDGLGAFSFSTVAQLFCDTVREVARWTEVASARAPETPGAPGATLRTVVRELRRGFGPLCPYLLDKLASRFERRFPHDVDGSADWLPELVASFRRAGRPDVAVSIDENAPEAAWLLAGLDEAGRLTRTRIVRVEEGNRAPDSPSVGLAVGPLVVHHNSAP